MEMYRSRLPRFISLCRHDAELVNSSPSDCPARVLADFEKLVLEGGAVWIQKA